MRASRTAGDGAAFPRRVRVAGGAERVRGDGPAAPGWTGILLGVAAVLSAAAIFLPLWGMTLVSTQYPEGLRMRVYPTRIEGDITEINVLNHYIGMAEITNEFFVELEILPLLFGAIAAACLLAAFARRWWVTTVPLLLMGGTAVYGFWSMRHRLYQFGNDLDPTAPIDIEPFTPPMFGEHMLAQFATYAYFSWGTLLPAIAGALVTVALVVQLRARSAGSPSPAHS